MKRMARERVNLEKPNDDYFVHFENDNLTSFHAYVIGTSETLYAHKFIKLRFDIPDKYPLVPPKATFIQHSGGRLHPNLYVEGKVCLSILGTWPGEKWAFAMTIETVLITIRSLLDNSPYKHEPHQKDNPSFNQYVQYMSWKSLLLDYFNNERDSIAKEFLQRHIAKNGTNMINELQRQVKANVGLKHLKSPYIQTTNINYEGVLHDVIKLVDQCKTLEASRTAILAPMIQQGDAPIIQQGDICAALLKTERSQQSPMDFAESQRKLALTNHPSPQSEDAGVSSPLKRKREIIDLT